MSKRTFLLALGLLVIGLIIFIWLLLFNRVFNMGSLFISILHGTLILSAIFSVIYIFYVWKKEGLYSFVPLLTSLVLNFIVVIIPPAILINVENEQFEQNFPKYMKVVSLVKQMHFTGITGYYQLPQEYCNLSIGKKILIYRNDTDINIVFFLTKGIGAFRAYVYSSSEKLLPPLDDDKYFTKTKKRLNWYHVIRFD